MGFAILFLVTIVPGMSVLVIILVMVITVSPGLHSVEDGSQNIGIDVF